MREKKKILCHRIAPLLDNNIETWHAVLSP